MAKITKAPTRFNYVKNVGRSLGYIAIDVAADLNPTLARLAKDTKSATEEAISTITSIDRNAISQSVKDFLDPKGENVINNLITDLKTGDWYNKKRQDNMGFDDLDFGGDFNFDDEDWGDGESSSDSFDEGDDSSSGSTASAMISGMQNLSDDISLSMGRTSAASAEYIAKSSHRDTLAVYDLTKTGFNNVSSILLNINNKLDAIVEMQAPIVQSAQNSFTFQTRATEFFESTNETLNKINSNLEIIAANTAVLNSDNSKKNFNRKARNLGDLITGGDFDLSEYFEMVKANAKENADLVKGLVDIANFGYGKNLKNVSPIAAALKAGIKSMMTDSFKETIEGFNKSFEGVIPSLIRSLKNKTNSSNLALSMIADMFLPDLSAKTSINKSNYNQGPVAWDGIARKSLVEVIPTYLAKIYGALGGQELYFDFKTGKFTSTSAIARSFRGKKLYDVKEASGELGSFAIENAKAGPNSKQAQKEITRFFLNALETGEDNFTKFRFIEKLKRENPVQYKELLKELGLSEASFDALFKSMNTVGNSGMLKYSARLASAQNSISTRYRMEEESGNSALNYLDNGFNVKDKFGMNQLEYMHNIYKMVGNIYAVISNGGQGPKFNPKTGKFDARKQYNLRRGKVNRERSNMDPDNIDWDNLDEFKNWGRTAEEIELDEKRKKLEEEFKEFGANNRSKVRTAIAKAIKWIRKKTRFSGDNSDENDLENYDPFNTVEKGITNFFDILTKGIGELFYGKENDEGVIGIIKKNISDVFGKFKSWLKDTVWGGIKNFAGKAKNVFMSRRAGGKLISEADPELVQNLRDQGLDDNQISRILRNKNKAQAAAQTQEVRIDNAAYGRKVTHTGLIAVSEGELIIPSEFNPFYHGRTNKRKQIKDEQRAINRFYGAYNSGGVVNYREKIDNAAVAIGNGAYDASVSVASGITHFVQQIMGKIDKDGIEEQRKKVNEGIRNAMGKVLEEMGESKNAMGIGAISGVGVSLLTGAFVGPIAGAAIGAGVGLIAKSKTLQNLLFGEIGEDGKHTKALGKALDFVKEKVTSIGNWGKEKFKGKGGAMIGGAGIGALVGGPFGIVGGALLGSAFGYLATTDRFKDFMFGNHEGDVATPDSLAGIIRDKIVFNLDDIFHNAGNMLKGLFKDIGRRISSGLKNLGQDVRGFLMKTRFGDLFERILGLGKKAIKVPFRFVGGVLGGVNKGLQKYNLRHGYNIYNREAKRNMTATERIARRQDLGVEGGFGYNNMGNFDQLVSGLSEEEIFDLQDELTMMQDSKFAQKKVINDNMADLYKTIGGSLRGGDRKKFDKYVRRGNSDKAIELLNSLGMTGYDDIIKSTISKNQDARAIRKAIDETRRKLKEDRGIDLGSDGKGQKALELLNDEISGLGLSREVLEQEKEKDKKEKSEYDYRLSELGLLYAIAKKVKNKNAIDKMVKGEWKSSLAIMQGIAGPSNKEETNSDGTSSVDHTPFGDIERGEDGKPRTDDSATDETIKRRNKFFESIEGLPVIGGAVKRISGLFGSLHEKLFGSKDDPKKKGLFGTLFEFLTGKKDSIISKLGDFFVGNGIGGLLKAVKENLSFSNVFGTLVGPMLVLALTGAFDGIFNKLFGKLRLFNGNDPSSKGAFSNDEVQTPVIDPETGEAIVDPETGEVVMETSYAGFNNTLGANLRRNTVTQAIRGIAKGKGLRAALGSGVVGSGLRFSGKKLTTGLLKNTDDAARVVMGNYFKKQATKKFAKSKALRAAGNLAGAKAASAAASKATKNALAAAQGAKVSGLIKSALENLPNILNKIPFLPKVLKGDGAKFLAQQFKSHIDDAILKLSKTALGKAASSLAKFVPYLNIAWAIAAGVNAWGNAESILGITQDATFGQKCIASVIAAINALIPVVGDLIPNNVIVNILISILSKLGFDLSELKGQRASAEEEVRKYNEENGTNLSIAEYNEMNGKAGIFTKMGHGLKKGFGKIKEIVKEKGILGLPQGILESISEYQPTSTLGKIAKKAWDTCVYKILQMKLFATQGKIKELLYYDTTTKNSDNSENSVFVRLLDGALNIYKITNMPLALTSWISKKYFEIIGKTIKGTVKSVIAVYDGFKDTIDKYINGDFDISNITEYQDNPEDPYNDLIKSVTITSRFMAMPIGLLAKNGKEFFGELSETTKGVSEFISSQSTIYKKLMEHANKGNVIDLWKEDLDATEDNPLSSYGKSSLLIQKVFATPAAILNGSGKLISDSIETLFGPIKEDYKKFDEASKKIEEYKNKGEISPIWSVDGGFNPADPIAGFYNSILSVYKVLSTLGAVTVKLGFNSGEQQKNVQNIYNDDGTINKKAKKEFTENYIKDYLKNYIIGLNPTGRAAQWFKTGTQVQKWFQGAEKSTNGFSLYENPSSSTNTKSTSGPSSHGAARSGGSSFINQNSGAIGAAFGNKGCGPAVASMTASALGKNLSTGKAINAAQGYRNSVGVDAGYFSDVLGQKGISTQYVSGGAGALNSLAAGNKVVLLGQDPYNRSKANSPFGPGSHYVLATGLKNGKVMVNDPENKGPKAYSTGILNNVKMGISAAVSGIGRRIPFMGRFFSGGDSASNISQIWGFLKSKGLSDAQAAGIMGCWQVESGNTPDKLEGNHGKYLTDSNAIIGNASAMNEWTQTLFNRYHSKGMGINEDRYLVDGNYYPGYGLAQWTGGRHLALMQFARDNNKDPRALETQLEYFWTEYQSNAYRKFREELSKATTIHEATNATKVYYEGYKPDDKGKRVNEANNIYAEMNGQSGTMPDPAGIYALDVLNGSTGSAKSNNGSKKSGNILNFISEFSELWTRAFSGITGSNESNSSKSGPNAHSNSSHQENTQEFDYLKGSKGILGTTGEAGGDVVNGFPYYNQNESPWASHDYGFDTKLKDTGCGPTSAAMVLKSYGVNATPIDTADYSLQNGFRVKGSGTSWGFFKSVADQAGLTTDQFTDPTLAKEYLQKKIPVIASMKAGEYNKVGHFIVLSDLKGNQLYINDPGSRSKSANIYQDDAILNSAKQFWAISRDGYGSIGTWQNQNNNWKGHGFSPNAITEDRQFIEQSAREGAIKASKRSAELANVFNSQNARQKNIDSSRDIWIQSQNPFANQTLTTSSGFVAGPSGGASGLSFDTVNYPKSHATSSHSSTPIVNNNPNSSSYSLEELIGYLKSIADNTDPIAKIASAVLALTGKGGNSGISDNNQTNNAIVSIPQSSKDIDQNIVNLVGTLAALAKG